MALNSNNMKDFFDKNNFSKIPKELEWENMEKGIFDKMEAMEKAELSKNKGGFVKRGYILLALLLGSLLIVGSLILQNTNFIGKEKGLSVSPQELNEAEALKEKINKPLNNDSEKQNIPSEEVKNQKRNKATTSPLVIDNSLTNGANIDTNKSSVKPNPETTYKKQSTIGNVTKSQSAGNQQQDFQGQKSAAKTTIMASYATYGKDSARVTQKKTTTQNRGNSRLYNALDTSSAYPQGRLNNEELTNGLVLASKEPIGETEKVDTTNSNATNKLAAQLTAEEQASFNAGEHLILEGGITYWGDGSGQSIPNKNRYEKPLLSFQIQGNYMRGLKNNFFFMTGFQYQQLESRFEYSTTIPDYVITLRDTVVQVRKDMVTGRQEKIYGDVQQTVEAGRNVVHYNTTRLFKVSLAAGKSWRLKTIQTDFYLGGTLNAMANNKGKTLYMDEVLRYNGDANTTIDNSLLLEAFAGARIHYFIDPRVAFTVGFQVQKSLMNWSTLENARLYPISAGFQLGISYKLAKP